MSAGTFAPEAPDNRSSGPANPALNPSAFERGWSLARFRRWLTAAVSRELLGDVLRQVDGRPDVPEAPGDE